MKAGKTAGELARETVTGEKVRRPADEYTLKYWDRVNNPEKHKLTLDDIRVGIHRNLNKYAQEAADVDFEYTEDNKALLTDLSYYCAGDERYEASELTRNRPSLKKGILILGSYGVGKSIIMRACLPFLGSAQGICTAIVKACEKTNTFTAYTKGDWYFDDLGTEPKAKFSKAESSPLFTDIIEARHYNNRYGHSPNKTHITTNLLHEELEEKYGERVGSRINEMFNMYFLDGPDYRQKLN